MPVPTFSVICTRKDLIAREVYEFTFEKPAGFTFKPGQFVLFDVPHPENPADIQTRAFSIASAPFETELLFVVKLVEGGRASIWFRDVVKKGTVATIKGPFGNFLLDPEPARDILFLCTSTGNAPFRSQIVHALKSGDTRKMDLIYGVRAEEDLFWAEEFNRLAAAHPNLSVHVILSAPGPSWTGHRGRVQTLVPQLVTRNGSLLLYACGNPEMTKEIKQRALTEWGIDKKNIHVEGYI